MDDSFCDICPISIKKYFDLNEIRSIFTDFIPTLPYRIRGFYFVPLKTSYSKKTTFLKWTHNECQSPFDFPMLLCFLHYQCEC